MADFDYPPIRRQDRAVDQARIESHLMHAAFGVVAVADRNQPLQSSVAFVYVPERRSLYFHTANDGHLSQMARRYNCRASMVCATMGRLLPARSVKNFSVEYDSAIVFGELRIVNDMEERRSGMAALNRKYFPHLKPGTDVRDATDEELREIAVYRLVIEHWTGKRKSASEDFSGAFTYGEPPPETRDLSE